MPPALPARDASVGVGISTYNRPEYARQCLSALVEQCGDIATIYLYDDGSAEQHMPALLALAEEFAPRGVVPFLAGENHGVAYAKNALATLMLDAGHDWIFLAEDDMVVRSPRAITGYIDACLGSGAHHLSFAHHGDLNEGLPVKWTDQLDYFGYSVGSWCVFTRTSLEAVGLFDLNFRNAWEHVEHEMRLILGGWVPGSAAGCFADARGSADWLHEIPGSIQNSSIKAHQDWRQSELEGLRYWAYAHPQSFVLVHRQPVIKHVLARIDQWRRESEAAWGPR